MAAIAPVADALELFSPPTRAWFGASFAAPTPVQSEGWRRVAAGEHTLMCAPTGSGKTLAAFLWSIDRLATALEVLAAERCRVLYVSPLKALTVDVERNLRAPLRGIGVEAERAGGRAAEIGVAIRTGDTPASERRRIERHPPDILITTPESLFLLLTSAARSVLRSVRWVIVDEIHSVAASKRGAHLVLSLERLAAITATDPQRIGLSATQRPLAEVGRFLVGRGRGVTLVEAGAGGEAASCRRLEPGHEAVADAPAVEGDSRPLGKVLEISVEVPVDDMADLERGAERASGPATEVGGERGNGRATVRGSARGHGPAPGRDGDAAEAPRRSIWPAIVPRLLELIRAHRSTIVFANSRRLAERLAGRLNELAGEELVRAHHGSIAREQRTEIEDLLKSGRLPALVATSSLELGIDMGAVDLVVQVEAPPSVAAGVQRIGRAGHQVGEPSRGVVFPKFRGDLLECAVIVERMLAGEIETTRVQRNPLDVLAQQVVAMCALDEWRVDELAALVRRAHPFGDLGERALTSTLEMLSGAYPSDEFGELRPRIVWDRAAGTLRGRAGAQRLAVVSGGTIPDRGLYPVNLLETAGAASRRIGELDEEMVYEMRPGETFVLGATTWRAADITPHQVLVTPAPGEPGKVSFWHGDALGRPVEVGRAMGRLLRELDSVDDAAAVRRLRERSRFDERAASNLVAYLRDQRAATGALPDDRTVVVERFRDQLGDWRLCVLTSLGARVHAPWALAVSARLRDRLDVDVQSIHTDDGFAVRLPDVDAPPDPDVVLLDPDDVAELVTAELAGSALFASRFRENAARSLLLPRRRPGERTPLWKQRQRAHDLLAVAAKKYQDFPILVETYRECLADVFDMGALRELLGGLHTRSVRLALADTDRASPFSGSLLFDYIAEYMYEGDQPIAERRAQALSLDRDMLAELLGSDDLRELLDPQAVALLELELQGLPSSRWPRDADEAWDVLRRLGDLSADEARARGVDDTRIVELRDARRVIAVRVGGEERLIAAEDGPLYRDALGVSLPAGLAEATSPQASSSRDAGDVAGDAQLRLLRRFARTNVPFGVAQPAQRFGIATAAAERVLASLAARGEVVSGEFRPGGRGSEWCHVEVLRSLRRRSLAALRHEIEPVSAQTLGAFLSAWQGIGAGARGLDRLVEVVGRIQGAALPASVLETEVLASRVRDYSPALLDELLSLGAVVWVGRGAIGADDGRVALYLRTDAPSLIPTPASEPPDGELHQRLRERMRSRGAALIHELHAAGGARDIDETVDALWDLVWAGEVSNDSLAPLRALQHGRGRRATTRRPLMRLAPPRAQGRWSLVADVAEPRPSPTVRLHALCASLLERHGVLTREAVLAEGVLGGFAGLYPVLRAMEEAGRVRRGYFVEGLGASQFALPGAVDRLRGMRDAAGTIVALSAVDSANPYGTVLPWPSLGERPGRLARVAGAHVVLDGGELRLYLERGGRALLSRGQVSVEHVAALVGLAARGGRRIELRSVDGAPVAQSPLASALREVGFGATPRGLVLYPERRRAVSA